MLTTTTTYYASVYLLCCAAWGLLNGLCLILGFSFPLTARSRIHFQMKMYASKHFPGPVSFPRRRAALVALGFGVVFGKKSFPDVIHRRTQDMFYLREEKPYTRSA